jgi:hypothetical protein
MSAATTIAPAQPDSAKSFLLQRAQPAMTGLIDGSSRHWGSGFLRSFVAVALAGAIIAAVSAALGGAAG